MCCKIKDQLIQEAEEQYGYGDKLETQEEIQLMEEIEDQEFKWGDERIDEQIDNAQLGDSNIF
jgi:hypothetical protein